MGQYNFQFFSAEMNVKSEERLSMETNLRHALERNEFQLYYQPWLKLKTGLISGMEALLRWQQPKGGLVPPGIPNDPGNTGINLVIIAMSPSLKLEVVAVGLTYSWNHGDASMTYNTA